MTISYDSNVWRTYDLLKLYHFIYAVEMLYILSVFLYDKSPVTVFSYEKHGNETIISYTARFTRIGRMHGVIYVSAVDFRLH